MPANQAGMVLYHCMIEIRNDAHALAFASAVENWLGSLRQRGLIGNWQLFRRKLGLASDAHSDFMLQIEVDSLTGLDAAFSALLQNEDDEAHRLYETMHDMIRSARIGLYRPYPDPAQRERVSLI